MVRSHVGFASAALFLYAPRRQEVMTMKLLTKHGLCLALAFGAAACSRNNIEAVNLANDGDQARGTNLDEAISKYEQATQLDPTNHRILWKLALAYSKKEAWDKVAQTCALAEKQAPDFANYWYMHGHALIEQAKKGSVSWTEAKQPLQTTISKDPNYADAYEDLADVNLHADDEQEALRNYSKAIETKPDNLSFYVPYADLLNNLGYSDQAENILKEALQYSKGGPGEKALFNIHSLLGSIYEGKGNAPGALSEYEAAKKSCGQCNEPGQPIAYFNVGAAYASANPPRKSEAMSALQAFQKIVCKGAAAARYADQCAIAQQYATKLGGTL
jgi:tetratricopeptide (TPR) repeat protein